MRGDLQPEIVAINVHSQYTDELADAIQELRNMRGVLPIRPGLESVGASVPRAAFPPVAPLARGVLVCLCPLSF